LAEKVLNGIDDKYKVSLYAEQQQEINELDVALSN